MSKVLVAPSILSADFARLADEVRWLEKAGADWVHVDVMDGHFVPNLTIGPVVVKWLRKYTDLPLDVHLMIKNPLEYAEAFAKAGAWGMTFHVEAVSSPATVIHEISRLGVRPGLSLKPKTPAAAVLPFLKDLNVILIMTVEPGFGGQSFMEDMIPKIQEISDYIKKNNLSCLIEVDGGIDANTGPRTVAAGANVLVAGNAIFGASQPIEALHTLKQIAAV